jgi:hypothetical protein
MKKIISITAILLAFSTVSVFAQAKTPSAVVGSFDHAFASAEKPVWTAVNDLYRVDFTLQHEQLTAYFKGDGELYASSRTITSMQLPISLKASLEKHLSNYTVSSLFEVDGQDGILYYARVSDQKSEILLQSTSFGDWEAYSPRF